MTAGLRTDIVDALLAGDEAFQANAAAAYDAMRDRPPLWQVSDRVWLCRSYDLAFRVLRDAATFGVTREVPGDEFLRFLRGSWLEAAEGGAHRSARTVVQDAFDMGRDACDVEAVVRALLSRMSPDEDIDLKAALVAPLAYRMLVSWFGLDAAWLAALGPGLTSLARTVAGAPLDGDSEAARAALDDLTAFIADQGTAVVSALRAGAGDARVAAVHVANLLVDSTPLVAAVSHAIACVLGEPAARGALTSASASHVVDEVMRLDPAQTLVVRTARLPFDGPGGTVPAGATVAVVTGAVNRDPETFADPATFAPGRDTMALTFGVGTHACVGRGAIRRSATTAVEVLLREWPHARLVEPVTWVAQPVVREPRELRVRLRPALDGRR